MDEEPLASRGNNGVRRGPSIAGKMVRVHVMLPLTTYALVRELMAMKRTRKLGKTMRDALLRGLLLEIAEAGQAQAARTAERAAAQGPDEA